MRERRRLILRIALAGGVLAAMLTIACWPTSQLVGVNHVISERTLPLWAKAVDFIHRDANTRRLSHDVLAAHADAEARATAAFAWTRANIRPTPPSYPIVDDHIWHIIVRGYGQRDQMADVFTTLLAYGGVPAYWTLIGQPPDELPLSYVRIRDQWRVYDVANGVVFRNRHADLATAVELAADHELIRAAAAQAQLDVNRYLGYFAGFAPPPVPDVSRADLQMPARRLWHEARRLVGMPGREWEMRPRSKARRAEGPQP